MTIRQSKDGTAIVDTDYYWQPMETCPSHRSRPQHQGEHMSKEAMKLALEALEEAWYHVGTFQPTEKAIDLYDEARTALREALAEQPAQQEPIECANGCRGFVKHSPPAQRTWVGLTDDDKCVKELSESDTDPEWIDGYTAGLKDAENKLRRYNAQPALVAEQLNPVAEVKLKQQGGNAGFATVIHEIYDPMREPLRVGDKLYTSPQPQRKPQQEPVAWRTFDGEGGYEYRSYEMNEQYAQEWEQRNPKHKGWVEPLYTTPPPCPTCEALARTVMMDQTGRDTSPPAQRTWVGLTDADKQEAFDETQEASGGFWEFADYLEAKLKEKNT